MKIQFCIPELFEQGIATNEDGEYASPNEILAMCNQERFPDLIFSLVSQNDDGTCIVEVETK